MFAGNQRVSSHLGKVPATDGGSPIRHIDAIRVAQEPVVLFDQEGTRVLTYRAIHIMKNVGLIPVHVHLIEPGTCFSKEHSRCDLKAQSDSSKINKFTFIQNRENINKVEQRDNMKAMEQSRWSESMERKRQGKKLMVWKEVGECD